MRSTGALTSRNGSGNPGLTLSEVAGAMDVEPSNGTLRRALERLIEDGYLERGEDKRYRPTSALFDNEEQE